MVNPGHPSESCATCRFRRIGCDATRPTCLKCATSKRVCLGYNSQGQGSLQPVSRVRQRQLTIYKGSTWNSVNGLPVGSFAVVTGNSALGALFINLIGTTRADNNSGCAVQCAIEAMEAGFQSLQEPAQTVEARRALHQKYQSAMSELRDSFSSSSYLQTSYIPAYMFALYEVSTIFERKSNNLLLTKNAL